MKNTIIIAAALAATLTAWVFWPREWSECNEAQTECVYHIPF